MTPGVRSGLAPTNTELDSLGAEGNLWPLLAACEERLKQDPEAEHAKLYRAAALVGLGVPELATEGLKGLTSSDADSICIAAEDQTPSHIKPQQAIARCKKNVDSLAECTDSLATDFEEWAENVLTGDRKLFRCSDNNVLIYTRGALVQTCDEQGASQSAVLGFGLPEEPCSVHDLPGILVTHWTGAPWLLERVLALTASRTQGYSPRVLVCAEHVDDVFDGFAMKNCATQLRSASTEWFCGSDAVGHVSEALNTSWRWALHDRVLTTDSDATTAVSLQATIDHARSEQEERFRLLTLQTQSVGADRTREEWGQRYRDSLQTNNTHLRVLLPSTRYTTYVQHAAEDLASAIRRSGDEAHVLIEPEGDLRPAATYELEAHAKYDPDLTIVINWPRASRPNAWPPSAPAVCWVQDMLGVLLDQRLGSAQSELDFTAGVLNGALFRDFGYPPERAVFLTTPACPVKFNTATPTRGTSPIDVAYVSHQSELPELMIERLVRSASRGRERDIVRELSSGVLRLAEQDQLTLATVEALTKHCVGTSADSSMVSRLMMMAALPLAERVCRHTTLRWASQICTRHGLKLGVFGSGWESTPLAEWARGPLEHTEELRSCYASAACHLHASLATNAHQRVFECALSGGLMLRRGPSPDAPAITLTLQLLLAGRERDYELNRYQGYRVHTGEAPLPADSGLFDPIRHARLLGCDIQPPFVHDGESVRVQWIDRASVLECAPWLPRLPLEQFPDWSYDCADETLFATENELEKAILRSVKDPEWRTSTAQDHRACALAHNTTDVFWATLKQTVADKLSALDM